MPKNTAPVGVIEHHKHERMHRMTNVLHDEVDDLVTMHLNANLKKNFVSERSLIKDEEDHGNVEVPGDEEKECFEDYDAFNKEQASQHGITSIGMDALMDMRAKDELKRRASVMQQAKNPDKFKAERTLPKFFAAAYLHCATSIEIKDYNENGTYYIVHERYDNGHGGKGRFGTEGFVLYTVRDSVKHRIQQTFCLAPKGPLHCPEIKCGPCLEPPWWETRGKGDEMVDGVDAEGNVIKVVKKGEKATKTGRLCVRMPGEHVLHFYDKRTCSRFVLNSRPLFFN